MKNLTDIIHDRINVNSSPTRKKGLLKKIILPALITVAAFTMTAQLTSMQMANQACFLGYQSARSSQFLLFNLIFFYLWALLVPIIYLIAKHIDRKMLKLRYYLMFQLPAGFLFSIIHIGLLFAITTHFGNFRLDPIGTATSFYGFFTKWIYSEIMSYIVLASLIHLTLIYQRIRGQELRAARLENELTQAQLQALKMQIHPHFLFNTLNSISSYIYKDQDLAVRMIARLSDLLRLTLETGQDTEISLSDELAITKQYLEIEQIRFSDRLQTVFDIPTDCGEQKIPALILQPLVENAIRHGISPLIEGGTLTVRAHIENTRLYLTVENDGLNSQSPCRESGRGIGLKNIRSRLMQRYGAEATLDLEALETGGCRARMSIPLIPVQNGDLT